MNATGTLEDRTTRPPPRIIQGGMGVGVSSWELASAVSRTGELGVVSGTALETVYTRRLQNGDPGGHVRRAFNRFPLPHVVDRVLDDYFVEGGIASDQTFKPVPMYTMNPPRELSELTMLANFAEVFLARESGGDGRVGINFLYKITTPLLASLYGAMLAGVDYVIVGAGSPAQIPEILDGLARGEDVSLSIRVQYSTSSDDPAIHFSPKAIMADHLRQTPRPRFLAIVSSNALAESLATEAVPPDGFVVEGPVAGGHNAPPRGPLRLDAAGEPIYADADRVDLDAMSELNLPFWLAGSFGVAGGLPLALAMGATGIQVGTLFALCRESGMDEDIKAEVLDQARVGMAHVKTSPKASPTLFPFKVVDISGSLSEAEVYEARERVCDVGALRSPFESRPGRVSYRCPAESKKAFARKRGREQIGEGRVCLCNALLATIGLGTTRRSGYSEPPIVTLGDHVEQVNEILEPGATSYSAAEVIAFLEGRLCLTV